MSLAERHDRQGDASLALVDSPLRAAGRPRRLPRHALGPAVIVFDGLFAVALLAVTGLLDGVWHAVVAGAAVVLASGGLGRARVATLAMSGHLLEELPRLSWVAVVATAAIFSVHHLVWGDVVAAEEIVSTWALIGTAALTGHLAGTSLGRAALAVERCLVVGSPDGAERLLRSFTTGGATPFELAAVVGLDQIGAGEPGRSTIESLLDRHQATRVIVLDDGADADRSAQVARRARNAGARVSLVNEAMASVGPPELTEHIGATVLLTVSPTQRTPAQMAGKRALDLVGSAGMLVALAPLLLVIAAAIRLTSRGPALFWQERIGLDGRRFRIAKFRTMVADAEARRAELLEHNEAEGGLFKMAADPRVTKVGRVLRKTSLDELPQLINVLRGEMSLVGPRPLITAEDALIAGWHRDRLRLKPGMTGRWQVLGSARIGMGDMVMLDQQYVASWSLWLDLRILLRTALFVVRRRGI
jgi:exopolysaccharide biosynthesis polyprenyl glycosylphosphotransferase